MILSLENYKEFTFDGFVSTEPKINGNILGATGYAWTQIANSLGWISISFMAEQMAKVEVKSGLLTRYPGYNDFTPAEDYWGFACGLYVNFAPHLVRRIRGRWDRNWGWMNTGGFTDIPRSAFWRQPALYAHLIYCCDESPSEGFRRAWRDKLKGDLSIRTQDGIFQNWSMIQAYYRSPHRDPKSDSVANLWWTQFWIDALTMRDTARRYIQSETHPLVVNWTDHKIEL